MDWTGACLLAELTFAFPRSRSHYPTIWRTHKQPSTRVYSLWSVEPIDDWRQLFYVLLVGAVLILVSILSTFLPDLLTPASDPMCIPYS